MTASLARRAYNRVMASFGGDVEQFIGDCSYISAARANLVAVASRR